MMTEISERLLNQAADYRRTCTEINRENIEAEYTRVSADLAFWGYKKAQAFRELGQAKVSLEEEEFEVKRVTGLIYIKFREELKEPNSKGVPTPPSEGTINSHVLNAPEVAKAQARYYEARLAVTDAQHKFDELYATCNAVEVKKEMLVSIGADRRAELNSDPNLRRMAREARDPLNDG